MSRRTVNLVTAAIKAGDLNIKNIYYTDLLRTTQEMMIVANVLTRLQKKASLRLCSRSRKLK